MFRKNSLCLERVNSCNVSVSDMRLSAFYVPSPIDVFLCQSHEVAGCKEKSIRITSDIYMLFNQQRLDRMTRAALTNYFENMSVREPSFATLKSKLTDDQLISLVKSRYIQSPSELLGWSKYLNSLADEELKAIVNAQQSGGQGGAAGTTTPPSSGDDSGQGTFG